MAISPEDLPQAPGANASLEFGQVGQNANDAKELQQAGGPMAQQAPPGQGAPQAPPPQQPPQPTQPAPDRVPLNQNDMRPGGPVFMQPQTEAAQPPRGPRRTGRRGRPPRPPARGSPRTVPPHREALPRTPPARNPRARR